MSVILQINRKSVEVAMFDAFVIDAISDGNTEFDYDSKRDVQELLIQFNLQIGSIIDHTEPKRLAQQFGIATVAYPE